ncbi:hypothetical protein KVR01_003260 [Diaporthe batatas]|uniref:uncharacterized protein n=1 Tax=Diaporthe batatas TaxID=748121 RepID=UPI001D048B47|nr:uncharacterized protein KVR01_003260 [Diaporthe batatas]KAG8167571.1 hypothetical protein KVR01_003260 [Diaporthe batatas]
MKVGKLEEKNTRLEEAAAKKIQVEKAADESRPADAGLNMSKQIISKPQTTTTPAKSMADNARTLDNKESKPASGTIWDKFITDEPPFPLTEIIALKPSSYFANFYAYSRRNGRAGMIKTDLIQDILKNSSKVFFHDAEMMSLIHIQPKMCKDKATAGREESEHTPQQGATDSDKMTENEVTRQKFEQVCDELQTHIDDMETESSAESKMQQNRLCIGALTTVPEKAKELGERSHVQQDGKGAAVVTSPSPSTLYSTDRRIKKRHTNKNPSSPVIEAKSLLDVNIDEFESAEERSAKKHRRFKQLWQQEWKQEARELADCDEQGSMSFSEAAKAAARYYSLTSAYEKPL